MIRLLRKLVSVLATGLAFLAVTLILLEIAMRLANALGFAIPAERATEPVGFHRDQDPTFGVWHPPNATYRGKRKCFDVVYTSNSHGARDVERTLRSEAPRAVVLGDSFVEGVGMPLGLRMSDLLEKWTGVEHLNFGTAGHFSSTQEWKLYETLASAFDHDWVLLFMFPNNDFIENDPERFWERDRYRPYLRRRDATFEVYYPLSFDEAKRRAADQLWWNRWYNAIFVYRLIARLDEEARARIAHWASGPHGYIGYEQFTEEDLERLFHGYRQIRDLAGGRELFIFTIPRLTDFRYLREVGYPDALPKRLTAFAADEAHIRYLDLMPGFVAHARSEGREFADYFHRCDGHWSELGNQVAAKIVLDAMRPIYAGTRRTPDRGMPPRAGADG